VEHNLRQAEGLGRNGPVGQARVGHWGRTFRAPLSDQLLDLLDVFDHHLVGSKNDGR